MPKEERQLFLDGSVYQVGTILTAVKEKKPELLQPKTVECHFCGYRPMRKRPEGCPYYKADEKKKEVS